MAKASFTIFLSAFAMLWSVAARAADTLADMDIVIDPALVAYGIERGVKHPVAGEVYHPEAQPMKLLAAIAPPGPVVFIGDSIMAGFPDGLAFPGRRIVNLAVAATDTTQILASLAHIPANASRVFIEGGINNYLFGTAANILPDYQAMLAEAPKLAPVAQVKVIGILPVNQTMLRPDRQAVTSNAQIAATDAQIANLCGARCSIVPQPFGKSLPSAATIDGIHLTTAGYQALAKALR